VLASVAAIALGTTSTFAQTGPELLLKPWPKGQLVEARGDAMWLDSGHVRDGSDFQLGFYETEGRARVYPGQRADPRFGYNLTYIDVDAENGAVPNHLVDTSVAFGMGVLDNSGWLGGITVGVGYAAAGAFDDGNAWYGKADFAIGRELDETSAIGFVLDYDGNRTIYPDIPLPGFAYNKKVHDTLKMSLGFPFTSIIWTPDRAYTFDRQFTFEGKWTIPDDFEARVDYEIIKEVGLFATYGARREAFHWDELPNAHDRLIFIQRRVEGGVIWRPTEQMTFTVSGGYAFDQEFNVGWDTNDQDRVAKPSDEPYLRMGVEIHF